MSLLYIFGVLRMSQGCRKDIFMAALEGALRFSYQGVSGCLYGSSRETQGCCYGVCLVSRECSLGLYEVFRVSGRCFKMTCIDPSDLK